MANIASVKKRNRQAIVRTLRNKSSMNEVRTSIKQLESIIASGNKEDALKNFSHAQSLIAKIGQKGIIHANTASRKISRLYSKVKALS